LLLDEDGNKRMLLEDEDWGGGRRTPGHEFGWVLGQGWRDGEKGRKNRKK
jgi:hypothetical protein